MRGRGRRGSWSRGGDRGRGWARWTRGAGPGCSLDWGRVDGCWLALLSFWWHAGRWGRKTSRRRELVVSFGSSPMTFILNNEHPLTGKPSLALAQLTSASSFFWLVKDASFFVPSSVRSSPTQPAPTVLAELISLSPGGRTRSVRYRHDQTDERRKSGRGARGGAQGG